MARRSPREKDEIRAVSICDRKGGEAPNQLRELFAFRNRNLIAVQTSRQVLQFGFMPSPHPAKAKNTPDDRIRFITYRGKEILLVDISRCPAQTVAEVLRKVPEVVSAQPLRSVVLFADFTGAAFDAEVLRVMKETAVFD